MAEVLDRLKSALGSVARGGDPLAPYGNLYRAKVRAQRSATRVDVEPDDPAIPPMANIPLKVGVPGLEVELLPDHVVMVGWENRRPDRPYATTWTPGEDGTVPRRTTVFADAVELGGRLAVEPVIKGETYKTAEAAWLHALTGWVGAIGAAIAGDPGISAPLKADVSFASIELAAATASFKSAPFLSQVVKTQ